MRRKKIGVYAFLALFLFLIVQAPLQMTEKVRVRTVKALFPLWRKPWGFRSLFPALATHRGKTYENLLFENEQLSLENHTLQSQLQAYKDWVHGEEYLTDQIKKLEQIHARTLDQNGEKLFFQRRKEEMETILGLKSKGILGKVIFRDPSFWSSSLWLNVGEKNNRALGKVIVAKNSPVVLGNVVVGCVENVDENQCRVRLITDATLSIAVRAVRNETTFLAKGEIHGSGESLWRCRGQTLKGIGFNYDFADAEGLARDLHTGKIQGNFSDAAPISLIEENDLLVTSGLDGVFPAGLQVGKVITVFPLEEGACFYEILATPCVDHLEELSCLWILPPL